MASITHTREQVRDGYLNDLPEKIRTQVMDIHKMIKAQVDEFIDLPVYDDLTKSRWAMSCIDEFLTMPKDKTDVGSFRVFKNGKQFRVMVQVTGHFTNHQYGWIEELLHDFICNVYGATRPQIRKKYDMALINEGRTGSAYEGFDAYLPMKICKEIWDSLDDRKTKTIKESTDESDTDDYLDEKSHGSLKYSFRLGLNADNGHLIKVVFDLKPEDVTVVGSHDDTNPVDDDKWDSIKKGIRKTGYNDFASIAIVKAIVDMDTNQRLQTVRLSGILNGNQQLAEKPLKEREKVASDAKQFGGMRGKVFTVGEEEPVDKYTKKVNDRYGEKISGGTYKMTKGFNNMDQFLRNVNNPSMGRGAKIEDAKDGYQHYSGTTTFKHPSKKDIRKHPEAYKRESDDQVDQIIDQSFSEATGYDHIYKDMDNKDAKKVLNILSNSIMKEYQKSKKDIDQYNASIYANTITKKLLNDWAGGFRRLTITLKDYGDRDILEFKVPKMTQDFVSRFIVGRESINGFLHRQPEIKIVMSPTIFRHMKDPDDPYKFFKAAVKYYDEKIHIYSQKLMAETMRLDHTMKYLIGTTSLSGLVTYPMKLLFVFNDMDISDPKSFTISDEDLNVVRKFIRSISSRYAAPEKEKRAVVNDIKDLVASLRESCDPMDDTMKDLDHFHEAAEDWLINHKYDTMISDEKSKWEDDQIDYEATRSKDDPQAHYLREAWGVKKLKKIPRDLVAYIQIETEAIRDSNDKMMIASYCLSKLEIVEWYIELIDVGSKKYIVPHPRPYLETIRTQLLACFDKIMKTPVNNNKNKPVIPNVDDL